MCLHQLGPVMRTGIDPPFQGEEFCKEMGFKNGQITPFHSESNGLENTVKSSSRFTHPKMKLKERTEYELLCMTTQRWPKTKYLIFLSHLFTFYFYHEKILNI